MRVVSRLEVRRHLSHRYSYIGIADRNLARRRVSRNTRKELRRGSKPRRNF
jgi:hypothetical protein